MDVLFERKISARKFHKTKVDEFEESVDVNIINRYGNVTADQEGVKAQ